MRIGVFAKTFAGSNPNAVLTQVAAAGFPAVQYNLACSGLASMPDEIPPGTAEAVAGAAGEAGVVIAAVSGTYNMIHPDPAERERGHRRLEVLASACAAMGAPMVTLCTGTRDAHDQWRGHPDNQSPEAWRDLLASMERAVQVAERYQIDLGVEPELANVVSSAQKARQLLDEIASARVKIVLDPANLFEVASSDEQRQLISHAIETLAERIVMTHAKDRAATGGFVAAGRGVVDFPHLIDRLREVGFQGSLVAHGLSAEEAPRVAEFLSSVVGTSTEPMVGHTKPKRP